MRNLRAVVVTALLALLVPLLAAPPALATPQWTPPEMLGTEGSDVVMDVNAAGDAVAVWTSHQGVKASYRPVGRDWQHPVLVGAGGSGVVGAFIDDRGRATAVWGLVDVDFGVADRGLDGVWRLDQDVPVASKACCWSSRAAAAADARGNLVVTWTDSDDLSRDVRSIVWRSRDGEWTDVGGDSNLNFKGDLAVHDGVATLTAGGDGVYTQTSRVAERPTSWKAIWPGVEVGAPVLAQNTRGDMVLAALDGGDPNGVMNSGDPGRLLVLAKPAGQEWRPAFRTDSPDALRPSVAISDNGRIGVTFLRASDSGLRVWVGDVQGVSEGEPTTLSATESHTGPASIAFTPAGDAVATWYTGAPGADRPVYAAHRPADGPWQEPTQIGRRDTASPAIHAYPNGMFTALFSDGALMWTDRVDDGVGPRTTMRAPARDFVRSGSVAVRWDVTDALSRPKNADVRVRSAGLTGRYGAWSMWRRRTTDTAASLTGRPGRTYCFSARARDRAGNLRAWSSQRCSSIPVDDRAFGRSSGWSRVEQRKAFQDTLSRATRAGGSLRLDDVRGTTLRLVARTCAGCGTVRVFHGGRDLGVFDLSSRRPRNKRVILLREYGTVRAGDVIVRVVSNGEPVLIDGLLATP